MSYIFTAVVFILIFSILIFVHEFGHFIVAKRAGIKVEEFGFGLPPRIWGKKKGETIYSINWIPFGGFVRLLGEDGDAKQKRSFAAQPVRKRIQVVIAGVLMNFLLAWILLFFGFAVGMQPLLSQNDVLPAIERGLIETAPGVSVKDFAADAYGEKLGLKIGDVIYKVDGEPVNGFNLQMAMQEPGHTIEVLRDGKVYVYKADEKFSGVNFTGLYSLPRVKIFDLAVDSAAFKAGLRTGDTILRVNDQEVFYVADFEKMARGVQVLEYDVYRNGVVEKFIVESDQARRVIVSDLISGMPAYQAGLRPADVILSVNGKEFFESQKLVEFLGENPNQKLTYLIQRYGERINYEIVTNEQGKIGVFLSELIDYGTARGMSLYQHELLSSFTKINDERYPIYQAPFKAFAELWRLSKMTAVMFTDFLGNLVQTGEVSEGVSGPVGIAQLTHFFVQEGFMSVLSFVAILSLTLGVINILPIPALDGGKLLFLLIEAILGRRMNQKWEAGIHALGYVLILGLIIVLTYSDIVRIFFS